MLTVWSSLWAFIGVLVLLGPSADGAAPEHWQMEIGGTRALRIEASSSLRLSQKHTVDVEEQGPGSYVLIALRAGLVYVRAVNKQGQVQQSWLVEVASRTETERLQRWKPMLCNERGIHCDEKTATVQGQSDSLPWLHRGREICDRHPPCQFRAKVTEDARRLAEARIKEELKVEHVSVDADGFVILEQACLLADPKREEPWRQWIKQRYGAPVQLRCREQGEGRYRLEVLAVARKSSDSDQDNPLQFSAIRLLPQDQIDIFLRGLSARGRTKILARPRLALNLGSSVELSDGMDIATLAPQRDQSFEIWKAVGFLLQVKLMEQKGDAVRTAVSLQISRPREGQRTLDRSALQTETWLNLDQLQLVGQIQAKTEGFEETRIPWLGAIPLLGALFRWNVESTADSHVYLLLRLQNLQAADTLPPSPEGDELDQDLDETMDAKGVNR